ncbi:hypothetical protein ALI22I_33810 [Saccharothrix sp. ALI-22-I]|uniref:hypothetical protein n=1 Tax=Saccharothrix sp. ALI-22-I TaxID=1933778 RepID=UPI00097C1D0B|nr:hypothetical protein [Saccharothrix sp. ALI-22-I]ONI83476.1 hypothetical protein ALI22I_33810 [Saccharothrix sp. ALI-22-I]
MEIEKRGNLPATTTPTLAIDLGHVVCDAVELLEREVAAGRAEPWANYCGAEDDPKLTRDGYLALLREARRLFTDFMDEH